VSALRALHRPWVACAAFATLAALAGTAATDAWAQSAAQLGREGKRLLVSKSVNGERWAITRNPDGSVTGNVTLPDGSPAFLWCVEQSRNEAIVHLACQTAPTASASPCPGTWTPLVEVDVPTSFLSSRCGSGETAIPRRATAAAEDSPGRRQLTPDGLHVLINKDVGDQRWAITSNLADHTLTGNVIDEHGPHFFWCERMSDDGARDPDAIQIHFACWLADGSDCSEAAWHPMDPITLSGAFLGGAACEGTPRAAVDDAIAFLGSTMDRFHDRFVLYEDVSSAGNHFLPFGKLPDEDAPVTVNGSWTERPHSGATAIRFGFDGPDYGGYYMMNGVLQGEERAPRVNFGVVPNAGIDLSGATTVSFWARGEHGGEQIDFFVAGVGRSAETGVQDPESPFPDSSPRAPAFGNVFTLSNEWQRFTIDVSHLDLSYVLGGFAWVATHERNPDGVTFYVDDVVYELSPDARNARLQQPRFLTSFLTLPRQPDPFDTNTADDIDLVLRNLAFSYDNALVLLAFLADGSSDGLRRARLIGDAFVYASKHDRFWTDGQIRTAYQAGDISLPPGWAPRGILGTVPVSGFYSEARQSFFEVEQEAIDVGNNAWVMIALLGLHQRTGDPTYLDAARRIGTFILSFRNDAGTYQGFFGRIADPESEAPTRLRFASVEHNLDVTSAFRALAAADGDPSWLAAADHSATFVATMWDASRGCFLAGTTDPETPNRNMSQLPLDVNPWTLLAIPEIRTVHPDTLRCPERLHAAESDGFRGFDFNDDRDGVWFEGTGHMATAYAVMGELPAAREVRAELRRAQSTPPWGENGGIAAAAHDGVTSGFGFELFRRQHIAATAWFIFSQLGFNPYDQTRVVE
jgi:hypothetical protein